MKLLNGFILLSMVSTLCPSSIAADAEDSNTTFISFEDTAEGTLPEGWRIDSTNPRGPLALWGVERYERAMSPPHVLSLLQIRDASSGHFNLAWSPALQFQNGVVEVAVIAKAGEIDQGGGPMWRAQDSENYYVARYNPLERNFRIYSVEDGNRDELASAEDLDIPAGQWFTVRIVQQGSQIEGWIDGEKLLELEDDTFSEAGGVGLWTKADAVTSFDNLMLSE